MPKSKKKKNKDFQKVKLKVGKRLPKADNETRTSFKARTIQVPQQLKASTEGSQPTTHRKLSLTDVLSQLQHYSVTVRYSALTGLRELIGRESSLLHSHLSVIVGKISELFVDKDPVVRQSMIRLLKVVLPQLSANQISPFFPVVSAHLCCAMTHIFEDIRLDSLSVLDAFLDSFPGLITTSSSQILPNFVEQISTRKTSGAVNKEKSLSVNPTSKLSTLKWRVKVLERLQKFLTALTDNLGKPDLKNGNLIAIKKGDNCKTVHQVAAQGCQPFAPVCERLWTGHTFLLGAGSKQMIGRKPVGDWVGRDSDSFVNSLLPLLLECWVESTAVDDKGRKSSSGDGLVSPDALVVMVNVVNVIQLLWRYMNYTSDREQNSYGLRGEHRKDFVKHIMSHFPYSVHEAPRKKNKKAMGSYSFPSEKTSGLSLNLAVCDIMGYFLCDVTNQNDADKLWFPPITNYLLSVLHEEKLSQENLKCLISVIRQILTSNIDKVVLEETLQASYELYSRAHPLSYEKRLLLEFLSEQAIRPTQSQCSPVLQTFLQELPALLKTVASSNHQMAAHVLKVIKEGMVQNKMCISSADLEYILAIPDGLLVSQPEDNQRLIIEILFYTDKLEKQHFRSLTKIIKSPSVSEELSCFLVRSLVQRFVGDQAAHREKAVCDLEGFLSFLMTVALGINEEDLVFNRVEKPCQYLGGYLPLMSDDIARWSRHTKIPQVTIGLLSELPCPGVIWSAVSQFLEYFLKSQQTFESCTAWSVLATINKLFSKTCPITEGLRNNAINLSLSLVHCVVTMSTRGSQSEGKPDWSDCCYDVWKVVIGCLKSHDEGLLNVLGKFQESVQTKDCPEPESAVKMLTQIVKDRDLVSSLQVNPLKVKALVDVIEKHLSNDIDGQTLADLKYHVSLLKVGKTVYQK